MPQYKEIKTKSLEEFIEKNSDLVKSFDFNTLLIFDIDGVFFNSIFSIDFIIEKVSREKIAAYEKIVKRNAELKQKPHTWIFTSRPSILKYFRYLKQLKNGLRPESEFFNDAQQFIDKKLELKNKDFIMFGASKTKEEGINVIKIALRKFDKIFYFAAQDVPWMFPDKELIDNLEEDGHIEKLTFINIR